MNNKNVKKGAAVTGVAAIAALALLFGTGKLGFGSGDGLGTPSEANGKAESAVVTTVAPDQEQSSTEVEIRADTVEIRIQGREYNYQNVSYGNTEHTLEELLIALSELPRDTRIVLAVEDDATKNAVDALEQALAEAGFTDVRK